MEFHMSTEYLIQTHQLCKRYKEQYAVDHIDLHVKENEIYGFIGRNGAGKSTTMKMLCGLVHPSEGEIRLFGKSAQHTITRKRIGALIEQAGVFPNVSARENVMMKAKLIGLPDEAMVDEVLAIVNLTNTGRKRVKDFSMGMKQRLGIAMALLGNPDVLLLDEPTNGLDPEGTKEIRETLLRLKEERGMTMIISSHNLSELDKIATCYGFIKNGRLLQEITREELEKICQDYIHIDVDDAAKASVVIERMFCGHNYKVVDKQSIRIYDMLDTGLLMNALVAQGIQIFSCYIHKQDLEHYYVEMMEGGNGDA